MMTSVMTQKLNTQMNLEFHASHLYISLGNWCMTRNLAGMGVFLRIQAQKSVTRMMQLFEYIKASGTWPVITAVDMVDNNFVSVEDVLRQLMENQALRICALECLAEETTLDTNMATLELIHNIRAEYQNNNEELKNILAIQYSASASLAC
ncbi:ferritin-like domain-containing protein [Phytobacter diazotrophicus]|uniref:ferritin-like domain-containing protein n=1 Tax=Phytobacter diazotrophicus TaxID=395631 RepID=UPI00232D71C0|nr:ferritin-like domain-containing protein [Phytobacter diazotrophicus]MDC0727541.1 ferritin-like domain-containing protein [Phytobacter diazotrophicus]MDC0734891.1 ferritin-like domain-containing protein [Phytobacter diazotrophicus]